MAGAFISIDANTPEILEALQALLRRIGNLEPAFEDIGAYLERSHDDRWQEQVSPDGTPWAPLSEKYQEKKPKNKDKILVLEGYLRGSLHYETSPKELALGTNLIYGATHQFGREEDNIPARPFLGVSAEDRIEILAILSGFLLP